MAVKGRREEYASVTRAAIVDAAIERFATDGFAKASIDTVAETARVSKGSVYHHFSDKAALFEAAFVAMEELLQESVVRATAGVTDPWELLRCGVETFLKASCEPRFRRIVLEDAPAALGWARWKEVEEKYFLGLVSASFALLSDAGEINVPSGNLAPRVFLSALGAAGMSLSADRSGDVDLDRVADLVMHMVRGLQ